MISSISSTRHKVEENYQSKQTANTSVKLTITSEFLRLSDLDTGQEILSHTMPNVSFASGGDADTADYIAYVGKDPEEVGSRDRSECCFCIIF